MKKKKESFYRKYEYGFEFHATSVYIFDREKRKWQPFNDETKNNTAKLHSRQLVRIIVFTNQNGQWDSNIIFNLNTDRETKYKIDSTIKTEWGNNKHAMLMHVLNIDNKNDTTRYTIGIRFAHMIDFNNCHKYLYCMQKLDSNPYSLSSFKDYETIDDIFSAKFYQSFPLTIHKKYFKKGDVAHKLTPIFQTNTDDIIKNRDNNGGITNVDCQFQFEKNDKITFNFQNNKNISKRYCLLSFIKNDQTLIGNNVTAMNQNENQTNQNHNHPKNGNKNTNHNTTKYGTPGCHIVQNGKVLLDTQKYTYCFALTSVCLNHACDKIVKYNINSQ